MGYWDIKEECSYLSSKDLIIPSQHLKKVCKCEQGASACRYIGELAIQKVYICVKNTPLKKYIDKEVLSNSNWTARGDNCDGFQIIYEESKKDQESTDKSQS